MNWKEFIGEFFSHYLLRCKMYDVGNNSSLQHKVLIHEMVGDLVQTHLKSLDFLYISAFDLEGSVLYYTKVPDGSLL